MPVEIRELLIQAKVGEHKSDNPIAKNLPSGKDEDCNDDCEKDEENEDLKAEIMREMKRWVKEYFKLQNQHF